MDALKFLETFGQSEAETVSIRAGTNLAYFRQIAYGHRRPSPDLAKKLAEASSHRLDVMSLLFPQPPVSPADSSAQQAGFVVNKNSRLRQMG